MYIDTHIHLYLPEFREDVGELILQAGRQGIEKFFLPNIDVAAVGDLHTLCAAYPGVCFPMIGLHPCSVKENYLEALDELHGYLKNGKYYGIGETGIDLFWDATFLEEQKKSLRIQIEWALSFKLPLILHVRAAFEEVMACLGEYSKLPVGIFHCFSGDVSQAERVLKLGSFKLGIGGVVTFKNGGLAETIKQIDLKHLVLETDAPYLAPVPYRGKRNIPSYLPIIARKIAELKNVTLTEVMEQTTANALEVFGIGDFNIK